MYLTAEKALSVHSLHLHSIPLTLPLRSSNTTFHFDFDHFTHNCICTQVFNSFRRYCSLFLCAHPGCPLILCHQHTDASTARAQNYASPLWVSANTPIMYFVIFLSQAPLPYGFVMVFVKPCCCKHSSFTSFRSTSTVHFVP